MTWQTRSSLTPKVLSENQWQLHWLSVETDSTHFQQAMQLYRQVRKKKKNTRGIGTVLLYPQHWGPMQCSQLIVATLVPSTPICLFCNLAKLQCKQTVITDFCIGFVNTTHIIGKGMIKETWIAKIREIGCWTEELITFCLDWLASLYK